MPKFKKSNVDDRMFEKIPEPDKMCKIHKRAFKKAHGLKGKIYCPECEECD